VDCLGFSAFGKFSFPEKMPSNLVKATVIVLLVAGVIYIVYRQSHQNADNTSSSKSQTKDATDGSGEKQKKSRFVLSKTIAKQRRALRGTRA
jgi:hypothetical protein